MCANVWVLTFKLLVLIPMCFDINKGDKEVLYTFFDPLRSLERVRDEELTQGRKEKLLVPQND